MTESAANSRRTLQSGTQIAMASSQRIIVDSQAVIWEYRTSVANLGTQKLHPFALWRCWNVRRSGRRSAQRTKQSLFWVCRDLRHALSLLPGMVRRVFVVTSGEVCMMRCGLVFSCFMMLCGFLMVSCRVFIMLCCLAVMLYCFYRHKFLPLISENY